MKTPCLALCALLLGLAVAEPAAATSGWGCFRVVNVESWDVLNMRFEPSASGALVGTIDPQNHGIIALNERGGVLDTQAEAVAAEEARCVPAGAPIAARWCSVTHFTGGGTAIGWVKRSFLERSECP
jgi:hypothetical protein